MAYININEVDNTIVQNEATDTGNVAFIPLNSSDGPSDTNVLLTSYDQLVQTFGSDPSPSSVLMTSWDYAANLLLKKMPVLVRRITHKLDDAGDNAYDENGKPCLLAGVNVAAAAQKVKDEAGSTKSSSDHSFENVTITSELTSDFIIECGQLSYVGSLVTDKVGITEGSVKLLVSKTAASSTRVNTSFIPESGIYKLSSSGLFKVLNASQGSSVYVASFIDAEGETVYDFEDGIPTYTKGGSTRFSVNVFNNNNQDITDTVKPVKKNNVNMIELKPGYSIRPVGNSIVTAAVYCENPNSLINVVTNEESGGYLDILVTSHTSFDTTSDYEKGDECAYNGSIYKAKQAISAGSWDADKWEIVQPVLVASGHRFKAVQPADPLDNLPEYDGAGYLNLFKVSYRYPGTAGNHITTTIKTLANDGIYLQVWNNKQRLSNVKLVNFRYKNEEGYWAYYDLYKDIEKIWALFLENFGIHYFEDIKQENVQEWDQSKSYAVGSIVKKVTNIYRCKTSTVAGADWDPLLWNDITFTPTSTFDDKGIYPEALESGYVTIELNRNLHPAINSTFASYPEYLSAIYLERGTNMIKLYGGSNASDDDIIHEVQHCYAKITDKYLYDVSFITNGGYVDEITYPSQITAVPSVAHRHIEDGQLMCAEKRGDCLALIDIPYALDREDALEYFSHLNTSYGTCYAPWVKMQLLTGSTKWCPPSFVALYTIAKSVLNGNEVYAPPAGVNRAAIAEASDLSFEIPSDYIDEWQDNYTQFINPIVYIDGYGFSIFGQKTLYNYSSGPVNQTSSALQYLNTRLVANAIKKQIFKTCIELTFEYNNLHTWLAFCTKMSKLLDKMKYNRSIVSYNLQMDESTMSSYDIQTNHIVGIVSVVISTTAEKFDITFQMQPNQVTFVNIDYSQQNLLN